MKGPLQGLRVIELARILAGPWAGQLLADLGADVVKVESPAGDDTRGWGPPFIEYADGGRDSAYFHACNRGKRSVVADFATAQGLALTQALCDGADVVIENFRVGSLARFGLDYTACAARNPRVVYCSITGFGQTGPDAPRAGYDFIIQAMGGIMDLTGEAQGAAQKPGVAYADIFTGLYAVAAIEAALLARQGSGAGSYIDLALFDTQLAVLANQALNHFATGQTPRRMGNAHPNLVPYQVFPVADGELVIAVGSDAQFRRLAGILQLPALADDPRAADNAARVTHREWLVAQLAQATRRCGRAQLQRALDAAGIPAGPVNTVAQAFAEPQALARGMATRVSNQRGDWLPALAQPIRMPGVGPVAGAAAPRLGEHTAELRAGVLPPDSAE